MDTKLLLKKFYRDIGLRKNPHLCRKFEEVFGCAMTLSPNEEEAACGAAMYAASHKKTRRF